MGIVNKKQTGSKRYLMKNDSLKGQHRINEQIRAKEVRIVGDEVESKVYPIAQALKNGRGNGSRSRGDFSECTTPLFVVLLITLNFFIS